MDNNTKVSVVIPAYNAENFIEDAIQSCLDQTYRPLEVIVVNDGSTDATANEVRKLINSRSNDDFGLRLLDVGTNMGAANALNMGFSNAEGQYVCWLSADDMFIDKEKISKQTVHIKTNEADWGYFKDYYAGESLSNMRFVKTTYLPKLRVLDSFFIRDSDLRLALLLFKNPVNGSSVIIKKDCVETCGQFDPSTRNIDGDGDLWMRYSALKLKLAAQKGAPVFYREHGQQTSKKKDQMMYGCELTRMRMLLVLKRTEKLAEIIRKFTPYFLIILQAKKHFDRPLVSEFLFNYIIENKSKFNWFLLRSAKKSLHALRNHRNYQSIDKNRFAEDLEMLMRSNVFKKFEENFEKLVGNGENISSRR
jgi:glycosyltransferase involved in cell wall biosynthesis